MVGLVARAVGNAGGEEGCFQLALVGCGARAGEDGGVGGVADGVGFGDEGEFVGGFDNAGGFDGGLEEGKVFAVELEEGDGVGDVVRDGEDGGAGLGGAGVGEGGVDVGGVFDFVDVVGFEGFGGGDGQAGPDDAVGVDWGDEECGFGGVDVVDYVGVGERAAGEVVEEAALAAGGRQRCPLLHHASR